MVCVDLQAVHTLFEHVLHLQKRWRRARGTAAKGGWWAPPPCCCHHPATAAVLFSIGCPTLHRKPCSSHAPGITSLEQLAVDVRGTGHGACDSREQAGGIVELLPLKGRRWGSEAGGERPHLDTRPLARGPESVAHTAAKRRSTQAEFGHPGRLGGRERPSGRSPKFLRPRSQLCCPEATIEIGTHLPLAAAAPGQACWPRGPSGRARRSRGEPAGALDD